MQFIVKITKSGMDFFYFESGKCLEKYGISSVQMWRNPGEEIIIIILLALKELTKNLILLLERQKTNKSLILA